MGEEIGKLFMVNKKTGKEVELAGNIRLLTNLENDNEFSVGIDLGGSVDMTFIDKEAIKMEQVKTKRLKKKYYKKTFFYQMLNGGK